MAYNNFWPQADKNRLGGEVNDEAVEEERYVISAECEVIYGSMCC